jgi:hypothetical protein
VEESIKVHVVDYGRKSLYLRYTDPHTGKQIAKSAKTSNRKEATKAAGKWEDELRAGRYKPASKITWAEFRQRYEDEVLPAKAANTDLKVRGVFNVIETAISPARLADLTPIRLTALQTILRNDGKSEATIKGILSHLRSSLSWAKRQGMIYEVPHIDMPTRTSNGKAMRGRPITTEEFERMSIVQVVQKIRKHDAADWVRFLEGLWLSGLRISEALVLGWDSAGIVVDLSGKYPMLRIPSDHQKSGRNTLRGFPIENAGGRTSRPCVQAGCAGPSESQQDHRGDRREGRDHHRCPGETSRDRPRSAS